MPTEASNIQTRVAIMFFRKLTVYQDRNDWWVGYYRGPHHHYVCPLPTLVIRWKR